MKIKNVLIIGILLIVLQLGFVFGEGEAIDLTSQLALDNAQEGFVVSGKGIETNPELQLNTIKITGTGLAEGESASLKIGENEYNNLNQGFIRLNNSGEISEAKFTINKEGIYVFGNQKVKAPAGSTITFKDREINLEIPEGEELKNFPSLVDSEKSGYLTKITGKNIKLPNGHVLNRGMLNYDSEKEILFLDSENVATIDRVTILGYNRPAKIFFDDQKHEGTYISFGEKNIVMGGSKKGDITKGIFARFEEGNPYIKIEEGDYVGIKVLRNSEFFIENRKDKGLIPKISGYGNIEIENDGKKIVGNSWTGNIQMDRSLLLATSSPMEMEFSNGKLFADNFNRMVIAPKDVDTEYIAKCEGIDTKFCEGIDIKFSSRVKYNYIEGAEDLEKIIGVPIDFIMEGEKSLEESLGRPLTKEEEQFFKITERDKQFALGRLRDYWNNLNKETQESISSINFMDRTSLVSKSGSKHVAAFYNPEEGSINFIPQERFFNNEMMRHESAHARHALLTELYTPEKISEIKNMIFKRKRILGELSKYSNKPLKSFSDVTLIKSDNERINDLKDSFIEVDTDLFMRTMSFGAYRRSGEFYEKWINIAGKYDKVVKEEGGYVYPKAGKYIGLPSESHDSSVEDIPLFGYISPYGGTNIEEDIATFVGIVNKPEYYKHLLSKDNEWHDIYRGKLDLLYEYKYITEAEYKNILKEAGVK